MNNYIFPIIYILNVVAMCSLPHHIIVCKRNKERLINLPKDNINKIIKNTLLSMKVYLFFIIISFILFKCNCKFLQGRFPDNYNYVKSNFEKVFCFSLIASAFINFFIFIIRKIYLEITKINITDNELKDYEDIKKLYKQCIDCKVDMIDEQFNNYNEIDIKHLNIIINKVLDINKSYISSIFISVIISIILPFLTFSDFIKKSDNLIENTNFIIWSIIIILFIFIVMFILKLSIFDNFFYWDRNYIISKKIELFLYKNKKSISNSGNNNIEELEESLNNKNNTVEEKEQEKSKCLEKELNENSTNFTTKINGKNYSVQIKLNG